MAKLFIGNFGFESRLRGRQSRPTSRSITRLEAELAAVWLGVAQDGDFILLREPIDASFFEQMAACGLPAVQPVLTVDEVPAGIEPCPWGWSSEIRAAAVRRGWSGPAPPHEAVVLANSRAFSLSLEQKLGTDLSGSGVLRSPDELEPALAGLPAAGRWVLKSNLSSSARDRFLGTGRAPPQQALAWLSRRLRSDGCVILEPWVQVLAEAGLQFSVPVSPDEPPRLEGITPTLADAWGRYRGSLLACDKDDERSWAVAVEAGLRAVEELRAIGYFGPVGIDAARYCLPERPDDVRVRPIQEINARWTMGRLALGYRRLLKRGRQGAWLHLVRHAAREHAARDRISDVQQRVAGAARALITSPKTVGGQTTRHVTVLLTAETAEDLAAFPPTGLSTLNSCVGWPFRAVS